jgi:hypothetical protein
MKRLVAVALLTTVILTALAASAVAAPKGNPGSPIVENAIYAGGELFGVIALGTLPFNGNEQSFDRLYTVPGQQAVAEAAPGPGYNGGRWLPVPVTWNVAPYLLTSAADVDAAAMAGDITLGTPLFDGTFLCPLIPG